MVLSHYPINTNIKLSAIHTNKFKTGVLAVKFIVPLKEETASLYSLLCRVILQGTESFPTAAKLGRKCQELYSLVHQVRTFKSGEYQIVEFSVDYLNADYIPDGLDISREAVGILSELIFRPLLANGAFLCEYVEREKQNLCDAIRARINNRASYAMHRLVGTMCQDEPYGVSVEGDIERICKITPSELFMAYQSLIDSAKAEVYYVGAGDAERIATLLAPHFANCRSLPLAARAPIVRKAPCADFSEHTQDMPIKQSKLCMGFRLNRYIASDDWSAVLVFCELFGASPQSKLFMHVREKLSLCYYCSALTVATNGIMIVQSGIDAANFQKVKTEVMNMLKEMQNGEFSDAEISDAKRSLINSLRENQDSAQGMENWYFVHGLFDTGRSIDTQIELIQKVGRDDICAVARDISADTLFLLCGTLGGDGEEEFDDE